MLVNVSASLYTQAIIEAERRYVAPEVQIEFWCRLGKAVLDNPEADAALIADLVALQVATSSNQNPPLKSAAHNKNILESGSFIQTLATLPANTRDTVNQTLHALIDNDTIAQRLQGDLNEFCLYQWGEASQLFQVAYKRHNQSDVLWALSLARKYVGM